MVLNVEGGNLEELGWGDNIHEKLNGNEYRNFIII